MRTSEWQAKLDGMTSEERQANIARLDAVFHEIEENAGEAVVYFDTGNSEGNETK